MWLNLKAATSKLNAIGDRKTGVVHRPSLWRGDRPGAVWNE